MGIIERVLRGRAKDARGDGRMARAEEYDEHVRLESAKVRAYRMAGEVADAAEMLMEKALELRAEIEAVQDE